MASSEHQSSSGGVAGLAREVEEFVASEGWDQSPRLFAVVRTAALLDEQPELADQLDTTSPLTPVTQEALPDGDLDEALAQIAWPELVLGCALVQEIIVLPPDAEADLLGVAETDADTLCRVAANHPQRTEARLVAAVMRAGEVACVLRLRGGKAADSDGADTVEEIIEHPELAPNLINALKATLLP